MKPDAYLVAEAWVDLPIAAKYWGDGKGLDAGFDFEFGYKVLELLNVGKQNAEFGTMQQGAGPQADNSADGEPATTQNHLCANGVFQPFPDQP